MSVKLLTEHHLEFLCLTGGCTGSYESTHVKMSQLNYIIILSEMILLNTDNISDNIVF